MSEIVQKRVVPCEEITPDRIYDLLTYLKSDAILLETIEEEEIKSVD